MSYTVPCFRALLSLILRNLRSALNGKKVARDVWFYYCSLFCGPSCLEEFCPAMNAHLHLTPPGQGSGSGALFSHTRPLLLCLGAHFFQNGLLSLRRLCGASACDQQSTDTYMRILLEIQLQKRFFNTNTFGQETSRTTPRFDEILL